MALPGQSLSYDPFSYSGPLIQTPLLDIFEEYDINRKRIANLGRTSAQSNLLLSAFENLSSAPRVAKTEILAMFIIFFGTHPSKNGNNVYKYTSPKDGITYNSIPISRDYEDSNINYFPIYKHWFYLDPNERGDRVPSQGNLVLDDRIIKYIEEYPHFENINSNEITPNFGFVNKNTSIKRIGAGLLFSFLDGIVKRSYFDGRSDPNYDGGRHKAMFGYDFYNEIERGYTRGEYEFALVYLSNNVRGEYQRIRDSFVPTSVNTPLYLSTSSYVYSDILKTTFYPKRNLFDLFENSDISKIKDTFGEDGCVPFLYSEKLSVEELDEIPIVNEKNAAEFERIDDENYLKKLELLKGRTVSQIDSDLIALKRKFNILDKELNIITSSPGVGRQARKPAINFIVSGGHCFLINQRFHKDSMGESLLNKPLFEYESTYNTDRIKKMKFIKDSFFTGSFEEIEDQIKNSILSQKERKTYLVTREHFSRIYNEFNERNKEGKLGYDSEKNPNSLTFIFDKVGEKGNPNTKNFTIKISPVRFDLFDFKFTFLETFYNKNTRSCFNECSWKYHTQYKNHVLMGIFKYEKGNEYYGVDRNKAYSYSLEEVLRETRDEGYIIPKICYQDYPTFLDESIKYSSTDDKIPILKATSLYFVRFKFSVGVIPLHDGCYHGLYLKKLIKLNKEFHIFDSFEIDSYLDSSFTIDKHTHEEMLSEIVKARNKCEDVNTSKDEAKLRKNIINEVIGLMEKYNKDLSSSFTDENYDTVKEIADNFSTPIFSYTISGKNFYSTTTNKKIIPISSNVLPLVMMIKQNSIIKIIQKCIYFYQLGLQPVGIRTDSILYRKTEFENKIGTELKFSGKGEKFGEYKLEYKGAILNQRFRRINLSRESHLTLKNLIKSNNILNLPSLEAFNEVKPQIKDLSTIVLIGNAGSGKTYYFEGDTVSFPKDKTLILTFEGSPSEKWVKKGYHSYTYHTAFKLAVGDSEETKGKIDFSKIENVIFEEFGKMSKNQQFEIKLKYDALKLKYSNIKKLVVTTGLTQIVSPDDIIFLKKREYCNFIKNSERYLQTLFSDNDTIIISLNYNMREKREEDTLIRNAIQKLLFNPKTNARELLQSSFKFEELSFLSDLRISKDEKYIFDTNLPIRHLIFNGSCKGIEKYYLKKEINLDKKRKLRIGTLLQLKEDTPTLKFEVISGKYEGEIIEIDTEKLFYRDGSGTKILCVMYPYNLLTGNVSQGETYEGKVNIIIEQEDMTFSNPFWLYQSITRATENSNITFYILKEKLSPTF